MIRILLKNFSFGDLSTSDKIISIATYKSVILTLFNVCFQLMIRGYDVRKATDYCSEVFPNYGPFLKYEKGQTLTIFQFVVPRCYNMIKEIVNMDEICRLYTEL